MKTLTLGSAVLFALAIPAKAGVFDAPPAYPQYPPHSPTAVYSPFQEPVYDWTGFYVGINGGGAFGHSNWQSFPDAMSGTVNVSRGLVGATMGYNAQTVGSFVLGAEFDFDWVNNRATIPAASCAPTCELTNSFLATARIRLGYAIGYFMPYVTGGLSIGDLTANTVGQPFGTQNSLNFNWTGGAGVEFVVSGPLTAKVEYLYVDHSSITCNVACGGGPITMDLKENIIRAGLNYRLWAQ